MREAKGARGHDVSAAPSMSLQLCIIMITDPHFAFEFFFSLILVLAQAAAQAPPRPFSPYPVWTAPQVKRCFKSRGEGGGSGTGAVRFCSAEKGGLFLADQPAILTGGVLAPSERLDTGVGWEQREERRSVLSAVLTQPSGAAAASTHCEQLRGARSSRHRAHLKAAEHHGDYKPAGLV